MLERASIVEVMRKLTERLEKLENRQTPISYAAITSAQPSTPIKTLKKLIIKPKDKQNNIETKHELNKHIDLSKLQIKISAVNNIKNGGGKLDFKRKT
ncbi:unnamed protein product [Acanthoscelides obtectus]|uniref:Uncharacterized protein n=1 Tax=Acanthoscelides obtectus TaxID=200917 RepID=A0A9P0PMA9_ACAOB|nr:unnamed protein product [Acanthoscelides obtectus]CAK1640546.1 hypothetical protein AOBTE_LOCUS11790 [Acanthoscelides obtectus]